MDKKLILIMIIFSAFVECKNTSVKTENEPIKAYCIDYNWGPGGAHGFAGPGLWADANPGI